MRLRTVGFAAALSVALLQTGGASTLSKGAEDRPLVTADASAAPRAHSAVIWSRPSVMTSLGLTGWTAMWDRDTKVPTRMWGEGIAAPGSMANPAIAESTARMFLSQHVEMLAPGAQIVDFVLVANQLGAAKDVRSLGFVQEVGGVRVVGGTISFSFKADRLVMVGSTALPNVTIKATPRALDLPRLEAAARGWMLGEGFSVRARAVPVTRVILPLVRSATTGGTQYHLVDQISVESTQGAGRWNVWIDASTGKPVARASTIFFASGRVLFDVPDRSPTFGPRTGKVVAGVSHQVNNVSTLASDTGTITWADGAASIVPGLTGPHVTIKNQAGSLVSDTLGLTDGNDVLWSHATEEYKDAQLASFVFATTAKAYARTHLNPDLAWLDEQLEVNVNENDTCNAFSTGDDIHFYRALVSNSPVGGRTSCQNTGRIADVVYHEFGHSLHANSVIEGVGRFDGAMSEGTADMLAAFITKDPGMGRGFFFGESPLRELEPAVKKHWPEDTTGEVHDDGEIIAETLWDLRKNLIAKLGEEAGDAQARKIYYGNLQRAVDIPSNYAEALLTDDDDGNLTNGTPNQCEINAAFGDHGLADPKILLGLTDPTRDGYTVSFRSSVPTTAATSACPPPGIKTAVLDWKLRGGEAGTAVSLAATDTTWSGALPKQHTGDVVQYKVTITLENGTKIVYPNNVADPYYEFYVGDVQEIWCADFEPGGADWNHGAIPSNRDEWAVGTPMGLGGDPFAAHGGANVLGIDLADDGQYRRNAMTFAESPAIDLQGQTKVRLQYYRWLGVEDGTFDNATILANGTKVWTNYDSGNTESGGFDHIDKEWRFQDVDLSSNIVDGKVSVRFELQADQGAQFAGWNVDDVCIVAALPAPACEADDTCDGGNGDGVYDNGCCSIGAKPYTGSLLSLGVLALVMRRRRRRSA